MAATDPTTKGTILRSLIKFLERDLSAEQQAAAHAALSSEDRQLIESPSVLASQKVSEFTLNHLTVEAAKAKGEELESFGRRAGRAELADAVGVYRFLTIVLTPTALLHKASSLWSTVHSHGRLIVENEAPGAATIRLVDFPSEPAHCARMAGWFEGAAELTRVKPYTVIHDQCLVRGDAECRWQLSWRK